MRTYRTPLLVGLFALGLVVFAGCDCGPKADCPPPAPVAVYTPPPPPPPAPRPVQGVCWVEPLGQPINMGMPPTVTLNQQGQVVSSTPPGRVQPPTSPDLAFGYPR